MRYCNGVEKLAIALVFNEDLIVDIIVVVVDETVNISDEKQNVDTVVQSFTGQIILDHIQLEFVLCNVSHVVIRLVIVQGNGCEIIESFVQIVFYFVLNVHVLVENQKQFWIQEERVIEVILYFVKS